MLPAYIVERKSTTATIVDLRDFSKEELLISDIQQLIENKVINIVDRASVMCYNNISRIIHKLLKLCEKDELGFWLQDHTNILCDAVTTGVDTGVVKVYDYSYTLGKYVIVQKYTDSLVVIILKLNGEYKIQNFPNTGAIIYYQREQYPCCSGDFNMRVYKATNLSAKGTYIAIKNTGNDNTIYVEV